MGGDFRYATHGDNLPRTPEPVAGRTDLGYYGVPPIHKPHWKWLIITYFFLGGISSGSYVIAAVAGMSKTHENQTITKTAHYVSLVALIPCPILLTFDLGRPERFLNMVRHFNPRSPMSLGTWGLLTFSVFSGTSAAIEASRDGFLGCTITRFAERMPGRVLGAIGTVPGFFVGGYTGVLLGTTAVPIWARSANLLGPLFLSSALSSAAAATILALAASWEDEIALRRIEEIERLAIASEVILLTAASWKLGETGRPLREGHLEKLMKFGVIGAGMVAPLTLQLVNRKRRARSVYVAGSLLALAGGFSFRYAVVMAGHASADDPQATFEFAR